MSRLAQCFAELRLRGGSALVPFVTAGDPDFETTAAAVVAMAEAGADVIELGVPFSDPIAEGPVIQRASERALAKGANLRKILDLVRQLRSQIDTPLVLMGYANPLFAMGSQSFARAASEAGVDGVIVADLPPEEGSELYGACRDHGIDPILLAAPTTAPARLEFLVRETRGFLYYVSLTGVTGARGELALGIEEAVQGARAFGDVPICVGFGISTPEQAREVCRYADGVVIGSAIVELVEKATDVGELMDSVGGFVRSVRSALDAA